MSGARGLFVTGTDTGVGKTYGCAALGRILARDGARVAVLKPIASGAEPGPHGPRWEDIESAIAASSIPLPLSDANCYRFEPAIAPHLAAAEAGVAIEPEPILQAVGRVAARCDRLLVEGVGGFRVPLRARSDAGGIADTAELAAAIGLPLLLVVGLRLGCINHALLTAEAIERRGLRLAGWVASAVDPAYERAEENLATLDAWMPLPRLAHLGRGGPLAPALQLDFAGLVSALGPPAAAARAPVAGTRPFG
ncbi:MAG: dethiobiotin synthase [Pseudomonadota bacterium]|jgi:dethiobiotin synthetase